MWRYALYRVPVLVSCCFNTHGHMALLLPPTTQTYPTFMCCVCFKDVSSFPLISKKVYCSGSFVNSNWSCWLEICQRFSWDWLYRLPYTHTHAVLSIDATTREKVTRLLFIGVCRRQKHALFRNFLKQLRWIELYGAGNHTLRTTSIQIIHNLNIQEEDLYDGDGRGPGLTAGITVACCFC